MSTPSRRPIHAASLGIALLAAGVAIPFSWAAASLFAEAEFVVSVLGKSVLVALSAFKLLEFTVFCIAYFASESLRLEKKGTAQVHVVAKPKSPSPNGNEARPGAGEA